MTDPILNDDLAQNLAEMGVNIQPIEVDTSLLADDGVTPEPTDPSKDWPMITEVPGDNGVPVPVSTPPGAESNIVYSDVSITKLKPSDVISLVGAAGGGFTLNTDGLIKMSNVDIPSIRTGNPKDALGDAKVDPSLVPPSAKMYLAAAFADGAAKYGPYNWRENAVRARVYIAAAMRHLDQYLDGESRDPTSKVPHLGHAMACLAILTDATETGNLIDDRPLPGAASDLIRRYDAAEKFGA